MKKTPLAAIMAAVVFFGGLIFLPAIFPTLSMANPMLYIGLGVGAILTYAVTASVKSSLIGMIAALVVLSIVGLGVGGSVPSAAVGGYQPTGQQPIVNDQVISAGACKGGFQGREREDRRCQH
jgi:hypothetical protein